MLILNKRLYQILHFDRFIETKKKIAIDYNEVSFEDLPMRDQESVGNKTTTKNTPYYVEIAYFSIK